jgi:hypothetical protein
MVPQDLTMPRLYVSAPVDEVQLASKVAPTVAALAGGLPDSEALRALATAHDLDFATMALYQALRSAPEHRAFIDALDAEPIATSHPPIDAKVLVVPALFHGHYPETGADAKFVLDIARACGFQAGTVPIRSVATSTVNAGIIAEALARETAEHLWLFTVSKGTADVRLFLQRHARHPALARIRGWVNACGIVGGCQIADHDTATPWRRLKYRAICRLFGNGFDLMRELRTDHPFWREPLDLPAAWQVFNFAAVPLGAHIQTSLIGRYLAISAQGPNDGMVLCREAMLPAGPCYPVWGCDHFFRGPQVVPLLYRFFGFLRRRHAAVSGLPSS